MCNNKTLLLSWISAAVPLAIYHDIFLREDPTDCARFYRSNETTQLRGNELISISWHGIGKNFSYICCKMCERREDEIAAPASFCYGLRT